MTFYRRFGLIFCHFNRTAFPGVISAACREVGDSCLLFGIDYLGKSTLRAIRNAGGIAVPAGIKVCGSGGLDRNAQANGAETNAGAELRGDQQIVSADGTQTGEDRSILSVDATLFHMIGLGVSMNFRVLPGKEEPEILPDLR